MHLARQGVERLARASRGLIENVEVECVVCRGFFECARDRALIRCARYIGEVARVANERENTFVGSYSSEGARKA